MAGALLPRAALAQNVGPPHETGYLPGDSQEFIALWPGAPPEPTACGPGPEQSFRQGVPDGRQTTMLRNVVTPSLTVFRPDPAKANGVGVIVCPGGWWGGWYCWGAC